MRRGGFAVIIGNPPYIELKAVTDYSLRGFTCLDAGNLYAVVLERCSHLAEDFARQGFIVPVSSVSTDRYVSLQNLLSNRVLHFSSFDDRPSRLFDGLQHIRLTIHLIGRETKPSHMSSTRYNKWSATERPHLFDRLRYTQSNPALVGRTLPKLCSELEHSILQKLERQKAKLSDFYSKTGKHHVFYSRKVGYFLQVLEFEPRVLDGRGQRRPPSEFKELRFGDEQQAKLVLCCLNSNLFYWFVTVFSDCRHVNKREVDVFPVNLGKLQDHCESVRLVKLAKKLMVDLDSNSEERSMKFSHDTLTVQCIVPKHSKHIIDEIDGALAGYYGFNEAEVEFLVNYDIKYRVG